jgi:serine phosphatase RsbU (regulator of sigma subunit)
VTVPVRPGEPAPHRHAEPPAEGSSADRDSPEWLAEPETVLLVEDDAGDALLVEELLADSGVQASLTWVRSLAEAKDVTARTPVPGCVLLDLHLPDVQGIDAVTQLLAAVPSAPVVVLTGLAEESAALAAVAAGAQDYLIKGQAPPDVFGRAIRYAAQRKQVEQASAALQVSALRAEENARLERALLPTPLIRTADLEVVTRYRPGRAHALLGGDFYDVVETSDGTVHAVIGDVCGHGVAEAALGVCLRVAWRSLVLAGATPLAMMGLLEQLLMAEREDEYVFVTLTHLAFSPDHQHVRLVRAGHPGLLLRSPAGVELIEGSPGPAVGLVPSPEWTETELTLPPGASLVLFTDGLFEGRTGPGSERLGEHGLADLAADLAALPPAAFVDTLLERTEVVAGQYGGLADDVAIVHLRWKGPW